MRHDCLAGKFASLVYIEAARLAGVSGRLLSVIGTHDVIQYECLQKAAAEAVPVSGKTLKKCLNIVFCGHVDAGKSTISGHIMYLTGQVDERTMEKYEREAKAKHRESWKFAWCMDTTDEERAKGKTQECGRGNFETEQKNYTILDAPGHKNFVPHMIGGASQADVACLVISVRKGEFEAGFDRGGQSREHAVLAKTAGVKTLVVGINKMDDPSVCLEGGLWDEERYNEVKGILIPFLKQTGFAERDVFFMPISGFTGANLKNRVDPKVWVLENEGVDECYLRVALGMGCKQRRIMLRKEATARVRETWHQPFSVTIAQACRRYVARRGCHVCCASLRAPQAVQCRAFRVELNHAGVGRRRSLSQLSSWRRSLSQ